MDLHSGHLAVEDRLSQLQLTGNSYQSQPHQPHPPTQTQTLQHQQQQQQQQQLGGQSHAIGGRSGRLVARQSYQSMTPNPQPPTQSFYPTSLTQLYGQTNGLSTHDGSTYPTYTWQQVPSVQPSYGVHHQAQAPSQSHPSHLAPAHWSPVPPPIPHSAQPTSDATAIPSLLPADTLPYHRKRLLELMDPRAYDSLLSASAREFGIDLTRQSDKRWMVEAFFLSPLPPDHIRCYDQQGRVYYHNRKTSTSSWDHPCKEQFLKLLKSNAASTTTTTTTENDHNVNTTTQASMKREEECKTSDIDPSPPPANRTESAKPSPPSSQPQPQPPPPRPTEAHTRQFRRANRGLSSTSSLFLSEAELAAWSNDTEEPSDLSDHDYELEMGESVMDDSFGGRDGERWPGEDGEDEADDDTDGDFDLAADVAHRRRRRSSLTSSYHASRSNSRPSTSKTHSSTATMTTRPKSVTHHRSNVPFPFAAAAPSHVPPSVNPVPWNSSQPPMFHPWMNASGVGDVDKIVAPQGSLISHHPRRSVTSSSHATRPMTADLSRPSARWKVPSRPLAAIVSNTTHARQRESMQVSSAHKVTRMRINGALRETSSHFYTIRQTLITKLHSLERVRSRVLDEDEAVWLQMMRRVVTLQAMTTERQRLFEQARNMLEPSDGELLQATLKETQKELNDSSQRIQSYLHDVRQLAKQLKELVESLEKEIESIANILKLDQACLDLAKHGAPSFPDSVTPPPAQVNVNGVQTPATSLPQIHALLNRVLNFQSQVRTYHQTVSSRKLSEKDLQSHLTKTCALVLRRGGQHCSERKARILTELLSNKAVIPSLTNQCKSLKTQLQAQIQPLQVCQKTYEMRAGHTGVHPATIIPARDENYALLQSLEEELASLTALVHHLESELTLTQAQLDKCMEQDQWMKAEMSTEDVRMKFYKSMLQVGNSTSHHPSHAPSRQTDQLHSQAQHHTHHPCESIDHRDDHTNHPQSFQPDSKEQHYQQYHSSSSNPHPSTSHLVSSSLQVDGSPSSSFYGSIPLGGSGHHPIHSHSYGRSRPSSSRPASSLSYSSDFHHTRAQLVRDAASVEERLRTRKVRRSKVNAGAALKPELLIPNAGRPVFEGVHSTGYDS